MEAAIHQQRQPEQVIYSFLFKCRPWRKLNKRAYTRRSNAKSYNALNGIECSINFIGLLNIQENVFDVFFTFLHPDLFQWYNSQYRNHDIFHQCAHVVLVYRQQIHHFDRFAR